MWADCGVTAGKCHCVVMWMLCSVYRTFEGVMKRISKILYDVRIQNPGPSTSVYNVYCLVASSGLI